jgi:hypothetical protein
MSWIGDIFGFARGGAFGHGDGRGAGSLSRGTDTRLAALTPGEFVINRKATKRNRGLLEQINSGRVQYAAGGGEVMPTVTGMSWNDWLNKYGSGADSRAAWKDARAAGDKPLSKSIDPIKGRRPPTTTPVSMPSTPKPVTPPPAAASTPESLDYVHGGNIWGQQQSRAVAGVRQGASAFFGGVSKVAGAVAGAVGTVAGAIPSKFERGPLTRREQYRVAKRRESAKRRADYLAKKRARRERVYGGSSRAALTAENRARRGTGVKAGSFGVGAGGGIGGAMHADTPQEEARRNREWEEAGLGLISNMQSSRAFHERRKEEQGIGLGGSHAGSNLRQGKLSKGAKLAQRVKAGGLTQRQKRQGLSPDVNIDGIVGGGGGGELNRDESMGTWWARYHKRGGSGPAGPPSFKRGGAVPGAGSGDRVRAMLEPGEFVLSRKSVAAMGGGGYLTALNSKFTGGAGNRPGHFQNGGAVSSAPYYVAEHEEKADSLAKFNAAFGENVAAFNTAGGAFGTHVGTFNNAVVSLGNLTPHFADLSKALTGFPSEVQHTLTDLTVVLSGEQLNLGEVLALPDKISKKVEEAVRRAHPSLEKQAFDGAGGGGG